MTAYSSQMITSAHNPRLQRVRALLEKKNQREDEHAFVVEGVRLVEEGLVSGWQADLVLFTAQLSARGLEVVRGLAESGAEALEIESRLLNSIAGTETPQGLLAVFKRQRLALPTTLDFVLIADNLRDPGNLGTLLRTAAAAGVQAVLLSPGATDTFAPKVLRAGMGAHFRLPIFSLDWAEIRAICLANHLTVFQAEASGGASCWEADLRAPLALLIGSEANGASAEGRALAGETIHIRMPGQSESLNAAIAAGILLFEIVRQRHGQSIHSQGERNGR